MLIGTPRRQQRLIRRVLIFVTIIVILFIILYQNKWLQSTRWSTGAHISKLDNTTLATIYDKGEILPILPKQLSIVREISSLRGVDALKNYCNSPLEKTTGHEGTTYKGFILKMVHIFIRHGDRTSIHRFPGYKPETYNCKFSNWYTGNDVKFRVFPSKMDEILSSVTGMASYFQNWSPYPDNEVCKDAILTSRGALQHLQLGQHIYNSYSRRSHLFENPRPSQMYVISTGTKRTFQSAVAFLYGFFPSFNISNFNIAYSQDLHFCLKKNLKTKTCECPHTRDLYMHALWFTSMRSENSTCYKSVKDNMNKLFEIGDTSSKWLGGIADALVPTFCHNFTIPCSTYNSSKCVDHKLLGQIWDTVTEKEYSNWADPNQNFLKYCSIKMTPVLLEVVYRIKEFIENKNTPNFILYSGHDVTLSPLLYVLGLHDGRWPPYASRVVIELYENDVNTDSRFYMKFLNNGVDKTEEVVFCKDKTLNGMCSFKLFSHFVTHEMLNRFGYRDYEDACFG